MIDHGVHIISSEAEAWKHAGFIYASYIITLLSVGIMTWWIFYNEKKQTEKLARMKKEMAD